MIELVMPQGIDTIEPPKPNSAYFWQISLFLFVQTSQKSAETQLQRAVETQTKEVDAHKKELETVRDAMKELKGHLYAKFGSSINLEDD